MTTDPADPARPADAARAVRRFTDAHKRMLGDEHHPADPARGVSVSYAPNPDGSNAAVRLRRDDLETLLDYVDRVEALFSDGPAGPCSSLRLDGADYVIVPLDDLREALDGHAERTVPLASALGIADALGVSPPSPTWPDLDWDDADPWPVGTFVYTHDFAVVPGALARSCYSRGPGDNWRYRVAGVAGGWVPCGLGDHGDVP